MNGLTKAAALVVRSVCLTLTLVACSFASTSDIELARSLFAQGQYAAALEKYERLANAGVLEAVFQLGVLNENGLGTKKDLAEAAKWYERAARQNHTGALKNLASMYFEGRGVPKDQKRSAELYSIAAKDGDAGAKTFLAFMYENGYGVTKDVNRAIDLLREAANKGYAPAQTNIGVMYWRGVGVSQSDVQAYAWWLLASEAGDRFAKENVDKLAKSMTSEMKAKAEELAKQYRARIPEG